MINDQVLNANIFFFITSGVVILLSIFVGFVIFYIIRLLKTINHLADIVIDESGRVKKDIDTMRDFVTSHGSSLKRALHISDHFIGRKTKSKKRVIRKIS